MDSNQTIEQMKRMVSQNEEQIRWLKKLIDELENEDISHHDRHKPKNTENKLPPTEIEYFMPPVTPEKMYDGVVVVMERMEKSIDQVPLNTLIQEISTKYGGRKADIIEAVKKLIREGKMSEVSSNRLKLLR